MSFEEDNRVQRGEDEGGGRREAACCANQDVWGPSGLRPKSLQRALPCHFNSNRPFPFCPDTCLILCDGIRREGLWKVMRLDETLRVGPSRWDQCPRRDRRGLASLSAV